MMIWINKRTSSIYFSHIRKECELDITCHRQMYVTALGFAVAQFTAFLVLTLYVTVANKPAGSPTYQETPRAHY